jgi:hypothetical protein
MRVTTVARVLVVVALTLAVATADPRGSEGAHDVTQTVCHAPRASRGYAQAVERVLRARTDVWGNALIRRRDGPTYEAARQYLASIFFARGADGSRLTDSGAYYVPFGVPSGPNGVGPVGLFVADGSEIVSNRANGPSLTISVGMRGAERYGSCLARLAPPRLASGYLPILETSYVDDDGARIEQESFAAPDPLDGSLTAFVRLDGNGSVARGDGEIRLVSSRGKALEYLLPDRARTTAYVAWKLTPGGGEPVALDRSSYEQARASAVELWERLLSESMQLVVPEQRVLDAERALLVQSLELTWRYSVGNPYEEFSYPEGIDVAEVMSDYGLPDVARAILVKSLGQRPTRYPNWKMGQKLVGSALYYRLFLDDAYVRLATPVLRSYVEDLGRQISASPLHLLQRERYSSDIPSTVYGLHTQAVVWQGLREMASVWRETGRFALARRCRGLATVLERGLREAVRESAVRLADGSLFEDVRLLDHVGPYEAVTASRFGSYWNLVMPYALASGLFPPNGSEARGFLRYTLLHGSRLLGLVRTGAFSLYGKQPEYPRSGVNPVYGLNVARFLADNDRPDQLTLSLYGYLAAAMASGTFVSGEAVSVAPLDHDLLRSTYLPPNGASGASFLETLRLMLVHETRDRAGRPHGIDLAFATPRAWLRPGKEIAVRGAPTSFGPLSFSIRSAAHEIHVSVDVPRRRPETLRLRLRLPRIERITRVLLGGRVLPFDPATETVSLSGLTGHVDLTARVAGR